MGQTTNLPVDREGDPLGSGVQPLLILSSLLHGMAAVPSPPCGDLLGIILMGVVGVTTWQGHPHRCDLALGVPVQPLLQRQGTPIRDLRGRSRGGILHDHILHDRSHDPLPGLLLRLLLLGIEAEPFQITTVSGLVQTGITLEARDPLLNQIIDTHFYLPLPT